MIDTKFMVFRYLEFMIFSEADDIESSVAFINGIISGLKIAKAEEDLSEFLMCIILSLDELNRRFE